MKFVCKVTINIPLDKVIKLYKNEENLKHWQDGYLGSQLLSGEAGSPGAKTSMNYKIGNRSIELIETIIVNNLPSEFLANYEAKQMTNTMKTTFQVLDEKSSKLEAQIEYTRMNGFIPKMMALFMPSVFKKQSQKWFDQFKLFAESQP